MEKFQTALRRGLLNYTTATSTLKEGDEIPAQVVFDLFQSDGFPYELTRDLSRQQGFKIDETAFNVLLKAHQDKSRTASAGKFKGGLADTSEMSVKYHTATHLLHQALREVLGTHVLQKGSNITPERLRFDFSHGEKISPEDLKKIEDLVNTQIQRDLTVTNSTMSVSEAKAMGALGVFEDKYGDSVNVYSVGDFSCEICGGPHVEHTGVLGTFAIKKEESAGAGVRRIKAILE